MGSFHSSTSSSGAPEITPPVPDNTPTPEIPPRWMDCEICHHNVWSGDTIMDRVCVPCHIQIMREMEVSPDFYQSFLGQYRCRDCSDITPRAKMFFRKNWSTANYKIQDHTTRGGTILDIQGILPVDSPTAFCHFCAFKQAYFLIDTYKKGLPQLITEALPSNVPTVIIDLVLGYL